MRYTYYIYDHKNKVVLADNLTNTEAIKFIRSLSDKKHIRPYIRNIKPTYSDNHRVIHSVTLHKNGEAIGLKGFENRIEALKFKYEYRLEHPGSRLTIRRIYINE